MARKDERSDAALVDKSEVQVGSANGNRTRVPFMLVRGGRCVNGSPVHSWAPKGT